MATSSELSSDIIFQILSRTTLETLDTCKAVSKTWKDITYESSFMQHYCQKTNNISGYFVEFIRKNKYVSKFVSMDGCSGNNGSLHLSVESLKQGIGNMKILASSKQGILCCVGETKNRNHRYYICKPSTKQWIALPNPKLRYWTIKVVLMVIKSNPLHYKIIRISEDEQPYYRDDGWYNEYYCEVFDSESCAWTHANTITLSYDVFFDFGCPPVDANGLVYFLTTDDQVLALNYNGEEEETRPRFSLPEPVTKLKYYLPNQLTEYEEKCFKRLVEYKGKLGFTWLSPEKILELWCYNTRNHLWKKEKEVSIESLKRTVAPDPLPVDFYNSDILLMKGVNNILFYNQQDASFHKVGLDSYDCNCEIFPIRSDFEPIRLKATEENGGHKLKHRITLFRKLGQYCSPFYICLSKIFSW